GPKTANAPPDSRGARARAASRAGCSPSQRARATPRQHSGPLPKERLTRWRMCWLNMPPGPGRAMSVIDLNAILTPVAPDDPCGADLEYDPAFAALDRDAQGKAEQQIGSTVVPASDPDWKAMQKQSLELLARTKDLRVGAHLTKALLHTSGWPGFAQGLAVLRGFVEHYWEGVHPRLDPTDDNDPTMRVNILA